MMRIRGEVWERGMDVGDIMGTISVGLRVGGFFS